MISLIVVNKRGRCCRSRRAFFGETIGIAVINPRGVRAAMKSVIIGK